MAELAKKYIKMPPKKTLILYGAGGGLLLVLFLVLYFTAGKSLTAFITDTKGFKIWLDSYQELSAAVFVFIRAFQTVIKIIPAEPLEIASGYAFGVWGGLLYCSLGSLLGSIIIALLSRRLGTKFVRAFINEDQIKELSVAGSRRNQRIFLIIFYLIPGTPKDVFTYIAGAAKFNLAEFFIITTICRIPSIITSTLCGASIEKNNLLLATVIFVLTAVTSVLCGWAYKKRSGKAPSKI